MKRRVMVVGSTGAGKTSLLVALKLTAERVKKTEMIQFSDQSIDTPGEFIDNRLFGLIVETARRAALVLFVVDPTRIAHFPPRLSQAMKVKSLGIITKKDSSTEEQQALANKALLSVGVKEVVLCSSLTGEGIAELALRIQQLVAEQTTKNVDT